MREMSVSKQEIPIDYTAALKRMGGDEAFLQELINDFVENFQTYFQYLQRAVSQENFSEINLIGHTLKGSAAMLSLNNLKDWSFQMEIAGKDKDLSLAKKALDNLEKEFEELTVYLDKIPGMK